MDERLHRFPEAVNSTMVQVFRHGMRRRKIRPRALAEILGIEPRKAEALVWSPVSLSMRILADAAQFLNVGDELCLAQCGVKADCIFGPSDSVMTTFRLDPPFPEK